MHERQENPLPFALLAILLVAAMLRFGGLSTPSLTSDEVIDLEIASQSLPDIWRSSDGFPPLHYFIFHALLESGVGENAGRLLAALYGTLTVWIVYLLARDLYDRRLALVAATLLAIWPTAVYYNREGRAYSLYLLLAALCIWLGMRALRTDRPRDWAWFVAAAAVATLSHYYLGFLWLALGILWILRNLSEARWWNGLVAWPTLAVLLAPALHAAQYDFACSQVFYNRAEFGWPTVAFSGWALLTGFCIGPSLAELHGISATAAVTQIAPWLVVVLLAYGWIFFSMLRQAKRREADLALLGLIPAAAAIAAVPALGVAYNVRYIVACLVPLVLLVARGLAVGTPRWATLLAGCSLLGLFAVSNGNRFWNDRYQNEDSRAAAEFLDRQRDQWPVLCVSHYMEAPLVHYLQKERGTFQVPVVDAEETNLAEAVAAMREASRGEPFWLFYSREFHGDPTGGLLNRLLRAGVIREKGTWPGAKVYEGDFARADDEP